MRPGPSGKVALKTTWGGVITSFAGEDLSSSDVEMCEKLRPKGRRVLDGRGSVHFGASGLCNVCDFGLFEQAFDLP